MSWLILWFLGCFEEAKVPCTAPSGHQLEDLLWPEIRRWHARMHPFFRDQIEITADQVRVIGGESFAVKRTARKENPEAFQGFHAKHLLFIADEASGIPEQIFEVGEGALSTPGARIVMTANPTQTTGYFHRAFHRDRAKWTLLHFDSRESPLVSKEWCAEMAEKYGEDSDIFRVRVKGDFPSTSMAQLIGADLAEHARGLHIRDDQVAHMPIILGADVSYFGDDSSVLYMRQGLRCKKLYQGRSIDTNAYAGIIHRLWEDTKANACFVDVTGWGAGVVDTLRTLGRNPLPVYFGGKPHDDRRFANKRAEMWWDMAEWLKSGGAIPDEQSVVDDLTGPEYFYTPGGKLQLEAKDDMKKRGLSSPDEADALAMTFAEMVLMPQQGVLRGAARAKTTYDVLNRR